MGTTHGLWGAHDMHPWTHDCDINIGTTALLGGNLLETFWGNSARSRPNDLRLGAGVDSVDERLVTVDIGSALPLRLIVRHTDRVFGVGSNGRKSWARRQRDVHPLRTDLCVVVVLHGDVPSHGSDKHAQTNSMKTKLLAMPVPLFPLAMT